MSATDPSPSDAMGAPRLGFEGWVRRRVAEPVEIVWTQNRVRLASCARRGGQLVLRLHLLFATGGEDVAQDLVALLVGRQRARGARLSLWFVEARRQQLASAEGKAHAAEMGPSLAISPLRFASAGLPRRAEALDPLGAPLASRPLRPPAVAAAADPCGVGPHVASSFAAALPPSAPAQPPRGEATVHPADSAGIDGAVGFAPQNPSLLPCKAPPPSAPATLPPSPAPVGLLAELFAELNAAYFRGGCTASIRWGRGGSSKRRRRRSMQLGCYDFERREIRLHPALAEPFVPRYVVAMVVYHEMLHEVFGLEQHGRRRLAHPPAFAACEQSHPDYARARAWERAHLGRLLTWRA